jgi:hypothetical protein
MESVAARNRVPEGRCYCPAATLRPRRTPPAAAPRFPAGTGRSLESHDAIRVDLA